MNKEKLLTALDLLKQNGVLCYAYRETVFELLLHSRVDGIVYLLTDRSESLLKDALTKSGFKDIGHGKTDMVSARLLGQNVEILCRDEIETEELSECIRRDLTIHSMMMRSQGDCYDEFGGLSDFHKKVLRLTRNMVSNREALASSCFELILKHGFTMDEGLKQPLNKAFRELPMPKKVSLIMMFRNYMKSEKCSGRRILKTLSLSGLFPGVKKISYTLQGDLETKLKSMKQMQIAALVCCLCGVKGEQLKSIPNVGFAREFYDCILKFIDSDLSDRKHFTEAKNGCTPECFDTLLSVKEVLGLISGEVIKFPQKAPGSLFQSLETSGKWMRDVPVQEPPKSSAPPAIKETVNPTEMKSAAIEPMEIGGESEEQYVEEEEFEEAQETGISTVSSDFPLRRPSENFYIRK